MDLKPFFLGRAPKLLIALALLLTTVASSATNTTNSTNSTNSTTVDRCKPDITRAFGMEGIAVATNTTLGMCPMIKKSCCSLKDQQIMFEGWKLKGEGQQLKDKLIAEAKIYKALVDEMVTVSDMAKALYGDELINPRTTCGLIASRVVFFKIPSLAPQLRSAVDKMHTFLNTSYQGVYCAVCDHRTHKMAKVTSKQVQINYSPQFCRKMISSSLVFLNYFHNHLPQLINLLTTFLTTCDGRKNYKQVLGLEEKLLKLDKEAAKIVPACKKVRNNGVWIDTCSSICEKFDMTKLSTFFEPNLKNFSDATKSLVSLRQQVQKTSGSRLLAARRHYKKETRRRHRETRRHLRERRHYWREARHSRIRPRRMQGTNTNGTASTNSTNSTTTKNETVTTPPYVFLTLDKKSSMYLNTVTANFTDGGVELFILADK